MKDRLTDNQESVSTKSLYVKVINLIYLWYYAQLIKSKYIS